MSLNPKIKDWTARRVWIVGASTGIGAALADALVVRHARVALSARRADALDAHVRRLGATHALALPLDITQLATMEAAQRRLIETWGGYDLVIFMAGEYKAMRAWDIDLAAANTMIATNLTGIVAGLSLVIPQFLRQGSGAIALVSSVAGYRGLPKSLIYGPTKAAVINLAETLYLDLQPKNIAVHVINPGFVKTPLTDQNDFKMPALISPEEAAESILDGFAAGAFEIHFPKRFTRVLKALRHLPYPAYFAAIRKMTGL